MEEFIKKDATAFKQECTYFIHKINFHDGGLRRDFMFILNYTESCYIVNLQLLDVRLEVITEICVLFRINLLLS